MTHSQQTSVTRPSSARIRIAAALLALLAVLFATRDAFAHATLVSSVPAVGSTISVTPPRMRLRFSEPVVATLSQVSVASADGTTIELQVAADPDDSNVLLAPLSPLRAGSYRVNWRIVSADGHPVPGSFVFHVAPIGSDTGAGPPGAESAPPPEPDALADATFGPSVTGAPLIPALLRGAAMTALLALTGLLAFASWRSDENAAALDAAQRLIALLAVLTAALLLLHAAAWVINSAPTQRLDIAWIRAALATDVGIPEAARILLAFVLAVVVRFRAAGRMALPIAAGAVIASATIGHAAAIRPMLNVPSKVLHLFAVALWFGGLLWLALIARRDPQEFMRESRRVSATALFAVVAVGVSGALQALLLLSSVSDLILTPYGALVLVKLAGLGVLVLFGANNRFRLLPALEQPAGPASLRSSVQRESLVMLAVILVAGLLAYVPTPVP